MTKYDQYQADLIRFAEGEAQEIYASVVQTLNGAKLQLRRRNANDTFDAATLRLLQTYLPNRRGNMSGPQGPAAAATKRIQHLQESVRETTVNAMRSSRYLTGPLNPTSIDFRDHDGKAWTLWGAQYGRDRLNDVSQVINAAYARRATIGEVRRELDTLKPQALAKARQLTQTAVRHTSDTVFREAFRQAGNRERYPFVRYVATLDSRTSLICASLHGTTWRVDDPDIKAPPRHINCRSYLKPATSRQAETSNPSFDAWLRRQPEDFQRSFLGPTRFRLFRDGGSISPMATADRVLNIQELKRRYPELTEVTS